MDEDGRTDDIVDHPVHDFDGMLDQTELENPRPRTVAAGQLRSIAVKPHDEDLGLDRAVDVPTGWLATHERIVPIEWTDGRVPAGFGRAGP